MAPFEISLFCERTSQPSAEQEAKANVTFWRNDSMCGILPGLESVQGNVDRVLARCAAGRSGVAIEVRALPWPVIAASFRRFTYFFSEQLSRRTALAAAAHG